MKKILLCGFTVLIGHLAKAQETYPVNGVRDIRPGTYAFTNATIVASPTQTITNGTLLVKDKLIEDVGVQLNIPKGYVVIDLKGKFIYPGLIDAYTTYGLPEAPRQVASGNNRVPIPVSTKQGAYGWNEAIKPEMSVKSIFHVNTVQADIYKRNGFTAVQSLIHDGIARGTSLVATLGDDRDNLVVLNDEAAAHYSFNKGTAQTNYPSALMGSIALLRQTYLDAQWYKSQKKEYNISLKEFNRTQSLPQIFEVADAYGVLRADKIAKEFGKQYIFKTEGQEYRRIDAMKGTNSSFIIPLVFPAAFDVEDPLQARKVTYQQMKDWELAPKNAGLLEKAGIRFAITSYGLANPRDFWTNLQTAIDNGLTETQALKALTETPAEILGVSDKIGTLAKGKQANFIITSTGLFKKDNVIYENWIQGKQTIVSRFDAVTIAGNYNFSANGLNGITLQITGTPGSYALNVKRAGADSVSTAGTITRSGDMVTLYFDLKNKPAGSIRLNGYISAYTAPITLSGSAIFPDGTTDSWSAVYVGAAPATPNRETPKPNLIAGPVIYPFGPYGNEVLPTAESTLFKNATIWTNEKEGILKNADILIESGKIKAIGKNLAAGSAKVIDATGKHITTGIVDEHSHIAISAGINEGTQSVTSEVRIGDILNPDDISLYRQLAGGVTVSQVLHGSANPIGGQSALIKHRWGVLPEQLKIDGADGFIKFALGENVKQSNRNITPGPNTRFPQTRMGVEQVFVDAFTRAKEYKAALAVKGNNVRRDLELDALVEILDNKRFITCHSYVQSELNMMMHVADSLGFKINTFTHVLEGYKVADKLKARGIAASTFSDWWAYKMEVGDAIPYNGKLMNDVGVLTGFNSDDDEMARRLNQEAGKAVAYGGMSEEDALKLVTLNPAKMLHLDNKLGSLKVGKDADIVLWSANPLSVYAVAEKTYVDGIAYWDLEKDAVKQRALKADEGRIIQKMIEAKGKGAVTQRPGGGPRRPTYTCDTMEEGAYVVADEYNGMLKK